MCLSQVDNTHIATSQQHIPSRVGGCKEVEQIEGTYVQHSKLAGRFIFWWHLYNLLPGRVISMFSVRWQWLYSSLAANRR